MGILWQRCKLDHVGIGMVSRGQPEHIVKRQQNPAAELDDNGLLG